MNKQDLIKQLSLVEHIEGGYFSETHRSQQIISWDLSEGMYNLALSEALRDREGKERNIFTSIYYLLTDDRPIDHLHKNKSDIMHYFQAGSAITYLILYPSGRLDKVKLGLDFINGEVGQLLVPGGCWKAAVLEKGEFGLLGEAVAPGFDYRDMEVAKSDNIRQNFPDSWKELAPYIRD